MSKEPNNKDWEKKAQAIIFQALEAVKEWKPKVVEDHLRIVMNRLRPLIASERKLAQEEVLREIWQEILQTDNSRGYRSVAIIDAVKRKASSLSIDLTTNQEEK